MAGAPTRGEFHRYTEADFGGSQARKFFWAYIVHHVCYFGISPLFSGVCGARQNMRFEQRPMGWVNGLTNTQTYEFFDVDLMHKTRIFIGNFLYLRDGYFAQKAVPVEPDLSHPSDRFVGGRPDVARN